MARIVQHTATGPLEVKPSDKSVWVCMCGLSKTYPFCDGHHKLARQHEQPGKVYTYDDETPTEVPATSPIRCV